MFFDPTITTFYKSRVTYAPHDGQEFAHDNKGFRPGHGLPRFEGIIRVTFRNPILYRCFYMIKRSRRYHRYR